MEITYQHLEAWKADSLRVARKLGYDPKILDSLDKTVKFIINTSLIPDGLWFGRAHYDENLVEVYEINLSCQDINTIMPALRSKGIPEKYLIPIRSLLQITPKKTFFDIYNQSGMDHELIGHLYNHLIGKDSGEKAAVDVEIEFAKARSGWFLKLPWKVISLFAPIILSYHKKDEF